MWKAIILYHNFTEEWCYTEFVQVIYVLHGVQGFGEERRRPFVSKFDTDTTTGICETADLVAHYRP